MTEDTLYMQHLLPSHYTCEDRDYGVNCQSEKGIDDEDTEHWFYITSAIRQHFRGRYKNIYTYSIPDKKKFDVYLDAERISANIPPPIYEH